MGISHAPRASSHRQICHAPRASRRDYVSVQLHPLGTHGLSDKLRNLSESNADCGKDYEVRQKFNGRNPLECPQAPKTARNFYLRASSQADPESKTREAREPGLIKMEARAPVRPPGRDVRILYRNSRPTASEERSCLSRCDPPAPLPRQCRPIIPDYLTQRYRGRSIRGLQAPIGWVLIRFTHILRIHSSPDAIPGNFTGLTSGSLPSISGVAPGPRRGGALLRLTASEKATNPPL